VSPGVSVHVDPAALAADLRLLAEVATRLAGNLETRLADLAQSRPAGTSGEPAVKPDLMTAQEVADALRLDIRTLRRKRKEGKAPKPLRGKGPLRWSRPTVQSWIEEHGA
jgi:predicted DNA-binding transcriptional regulator AlpA